ncbi:hypothetical protein [Sulfitobacter sp. EhC04]|uniref:hypothetical protein n=1 Tax=Sulfitobacter sp. EhC04 TaxID=1849168 RepID=UPI0010FF1691|nr:hypothetical protein [Sulfitobacter sp. EhC04]
MATNNRPNGEAFSKLFLKRQKPARLAGHIDPQARATTRKNQTEDETMKTNTRFIKNVVETAAKNDTVMPWARGARRKAFIAKRTASDASARKTA